MGIPLVRIQNFVGSWHTAKLQFHVCHSRVSVIGKTHDGLLLAEGNRLRVVAYRQRKWF